MSTDLFNSYLDAISILILLKTGCSNILFGIPIWLHLWNNVGCFFRCHLYLRLFESGPRLFLLSCVRHGFSYCACLLNLLINFYVSKSCNGSARVIFLRYFRLHSFGHSSPQSKFGEPSTITPMVPLLSSSPSLL